jgi:hypothetical protein
MGPDTEYQTVVRNMLLFWIGMGPAMPVFTLAAQNAVKVNQLGVVTALTQFARSIGSTLGVAVFGSVLTNRFGPAFTAALPAQAAAAIPPEQLAQLQNPQALLNPQSADATRQTLAALGPEGEQVYAALFGAIKLGLVAALHDVFLTGAIVASLALLTVLFLKELPLRKSFGPPVTADATSSAAQVGNDAVPSLPPLRPEDQPRVPLVRRLDPEHPRPRRSA